MPHLKNLNTRLLKLDVDGDERMDMGNTTCPFLKFHHSLNGKNGKGIKIVPASSFTMASDKWVSGHHGNMPI